MTPELIAAAVRLADTLSRENLALAALDLAAAGALLEDKTRDLQGFAVAGAAALPLLSAGGRSQMRDIAQRLAMLAVENRRLLERAILVQGRVIGTIARAVPRALAGDARGYGRDGGLAVARSLPAVAFRASA